MQCEEKWKAMMSVLGGDAKILDLWMISALFEICPKGVKEQMMMRSARTTRISRRRCVIHDQQDRSSARRTEIFARVDGSGLREWQRTRRGLGRPGRGSKGDRHVTIAGSWDTGRGIEEGKARVKGMAETEARDAPKVRIREMNGAGKKIQANLEDTREGPSGEPTSWGYRGRCWTQVDRVSMESPWHPG